MLFAVFRKKVKRSSLHCYTLHPIVFFIQVPVQVIGPGGLPFTAGFAAPDEAEEDEDEELGHAETYAEYMPPKCKEQM